MTNISYLNQSAGDAFNERVDEANEQDGTDISKRDFTGPDFTAWADALFFPNKPYSDRGIHPSGIGINRYIKPSQLSIEARSYLQKQGNLQNQSDATVKFNSYGQQQKKWTCQLDEEGSRSQPPRDKNDIPIHYQIHKKLIPLIPKDCFELGISGGEPTLMGDLFFDLLSQIKSELPDTEIHLLTNGRSFAWNHMAERLGALDYRRLMLGIPVYADYYQVHDYIVQAENAFYQTILGLHNLARYNQRLEVRVVLHKQSIPRLTRLAKYIYKNLPFVEHVTFMGLEYVGYTPHNIDKLWIDPYDYQGELGEAVEFLAGQGMHVSIYNTSLCVLPERLWKFARKSISDWKNDYLPECSSCSKLDDCGGLFTWNLKKHSEHIRPFTA